MTNHHAAQILTLKQDAHDILELYHANQYDYYQRLFQMLMFEIKKVKEMKIFKITITQYR